MAPFLWLVGEKMADDIRVTIIYLSLLFPFLSLMQFHFLSRIPSFGLVKKNRTGLKHPVLKSGFSSASLMSLRSAVDGSVRVSSGSRSTSSTRALMEQKEASAPPNVQQESVLLLHHRLRLHRDVGPVMSVCGPFQRFLIHGLFHLPPAVNLPLPERLHPPLPGPAVQNISPRCSLALGRCQWLWSAEIIKGISYLHLPHPH